MRIAGCDMCIAKAAIMVPNALIRRYFYVWRIWALEGVTTVLNASAIYEIDAFHDGEVEMFFTKAASLVREASTCDDGISCNSALVSANLVKNALSDFIDLYLASRLREIADGMSD